MNKNGCRLKNERIARLVLLLQNRLSKKRRIIKHREKEKNARSATEAFSAL
jgi:hypothetical protein